MGSNSEIQEYNVYPMLHFHRKFSSSVTLWLHGIIAKNSSLVRRKKPYVERSGKMLIKGIGLVLQQEIRIAMASLNQ